MPRKGIPFVSKDRKIKIEFKKDRNWDKKKFNLFSDQVTYNVVEHLELFSL